MAVNCSPFGPKPQFEISSGVPAIGNKLFFYAAGSVNTKQNTYTDSTGSVANANPIILNSLGQPTAEIWFTDGQGYKVVYAPSTDTDPPTSPIWTIDNLRGINDTTTSIGQWIVGPAPTYTSATQFTLLGDQTSIFTVGRRIKTTNTSGTIYSSITASAYGALTTVTVVNDSGILDAGLSAVSYSILSPTDSAVPSTLNRITSINGGPLAGLANKIINGNAMIDRWNSGAAVTPASSAYVIDRFKAYISQASKLTFQQVGDAPAGFKNSIKVTVASKFSPGAADYFQIGQPIEGANIVELQEGTATAVSITLSSYIKGSVAGDYPVSIQSSTGDRSYVGLITVTTSWAPVSITVPGCTSGTFNTDNTTGLSVIFDLGSGSNFNTTENAWQAGNYSRTAASTTFVNQANGSTLNITGVQLEVGSVATAFEQRQALELGFCEYYLPAFLGQYNAWVAAATAAGTAYMIVPFKKKTRVAPTGVLVNAASSFTAEIPAGSVLTSMTLDVAGVESASVAIVATGSFTAMGAHVVFANSASSKLLFTGCEL